MKDFKTIRVSGLPRFPLGELLMTAKADSIIPRDDVNRAMVRHQHGDWGDLSDEAKVLNNEALWNGCRLLSAYHDRNGVKFWIVTEAGRHTTSVLLPDEYRT